MNTQAVNTLGGLCQLTGVVLAVRDLLELHRHRGDLKRLKQRLDQARAAVARWVRRLLHRPIRQDARAAAGVASVRAVATASGVAFHPFKLDANQPLEAQVAALGQAINQLREQLRDEAVNRSRAIQEEQQRARQELEAEARRLRDDIAGVEGKLAGLDRLTTGDLRLRRDGIVLLLFGIVLTTWPEWWAEHALGWLSWPLVAGLVVAYVAWRLCKAILVEIGAG